MACHGCKTCDIHCDDGAYAATNYYEEQMIHLEAGEKRHVT
jgi:MinD superfamily P-loop ATPase